MVNQSLTSRHSVVKLGICPRLFADHIELVTDQSQISHRSVTDCADQSLTDSRLNEKLLPDV